MKMNIKRWNELAGKENLTESERKELEEMKPKIKGIKKTPDF